MPIEKISLSNDASGARILHIANEKDMLNKGRTFAHVKMKPQDVVEWHFHEGENEIYYILSGKALFTDNDRSTHIVSAGDVCKIAANEGHGIKNIGDETLEFIALILYE